MLSEEELAEIERMWAGATQGTWTTEPHGNTVALYAGRSNERHGLRLFNLDDGDSNAVANQGAIAKAPEHIATLLHEVRGLRGVEKRVGELEDENEHLQKAPGYDALRLEETLENLAKANRWIAHLERELHARGGPVPRIADLVEAQDRAQADALRRRADMMEKMSPNDAERLSKAASLRRAAEAIEGGGELVAPVRPPGSGTPLVRATSQIAASWTREKPRSAGVYWVRKGDRVEVVGLEPLAPGVNGSELITKIGRLIGHDGMMEDEDYWDEWAGPLDPPASSVDAPQSSPPESTPTWPRKMTVNLTLHDASAKPENDDEKS